jgi:ketosteroid isomerase-like protein
MKTTVLALLLAATACAPKMLPGTDVKETRDTRALYDVVNQWVKGMNDRDAATVLAVVAPDYYDDAGTPDPADDMDRARLEKALPETFSKVEGSRLAVTIRRMDVDDKAGTATTELYYDSYYRVQTPSGPIPRRDADVYRLRLKKEGGAWKIVAGL